MPDNDTTAAPRFRMTSRGTPWPVLSLFLTGACTQWQTLASPYPNSFPPRQQVQVWTTDGLLQLQAVRLDSQILSGVPFTQAPDCDSCRIVIPLTQVDSVRTGAHETTGILLGALPFVALAGVVVALSIGMSGD